jgi:thiol-disulfide isomerase/thioredoxin
VSKPKPRPGSRSRAEEAKPRTNLPGRGLSRSTLKPVAIAGALILLVIVVLVGARLLLFNQESTPGSSEAPVPDTVLADVASVPLATSNQIGAGSAQDSFVAARGPALLGPNGHPEVLYVGAEYCPFCAAERWAIVVALNRFGSFAGLKTTRSAADDVFPSTPTFSFYGAAYQSPYVDFAAVELTTNQRINGTYPPLQKLSPEEQQLLDRYDAPPYVPAESAGAIPFVDVGNIYVLSGASVSPGLLTNRSWEQIAASLKDPGSDTAKAIVGGANLLTAAVCQTTADQPVEVCSQPAIKQLEAELTRLTPPSGSG